MKKLFVLTAIGAVFGSSNALANEPVSYELHWVIAPHEIPAEPSWYKKQAQIVETTLIPTELYSTESEILMQNGKPLLPAGSQLARLSSRLFIVCNIRKTKSGLSSRKRVCLVDSDNNGKVDFYFTRGSGGYYWFKLDGEIPSKTKPIEPVALKKTAPVDMIEQPVMTFHYQRVLDGGLTLPLTQEGGQVVRFHFKVGTKKRKEWMVRECRSPKLPSYCADAALPSTFEFAGLKLNILEREKEKLKIEVVSPFSRQKVKLVETFNGYTTGELLLVD